MSFELFNTTRRDIPVDRLGLAVRKVLEEEGCRAGGIEAVYCGDRMIHRINREYLGHDCPTDTITFSYGSGKEIEGVFYISLDMIETNARRFATDFENELFRVTIHSVLHLAGYDDRNDDEKAVMRQKEERYLAEMENW